MTTSWGEAFRNSQEYEEPDPVWESLQHRRDILEFLAREGGIDQCDVTYKSGASGRDHVAGYTWWATCSKYVDDADEWEDVLNVEGTFEQVKAAFEAEFGASHIEEMFHG